MKAGPLSDLMFGFLETRLGGSHVQFVSLAKGSEYRIMNHGFVLRPAWTPFTILLMILGFVVFWPLGLLMLAYILWGDRIPDFRRNVGDSGRQWTREFRGCGSGSRNTSRSGNVAFDEYRAKELERLEQERRRLDEDRREFEEFVRNLRRAKDQEEFDRFMADRQTNKAGPSA